MKTGKLVSIVLTLAMLLSVLPMSAMAYGGTSKDKTAEIKVSFDDIEDTDNPRPLASVTLVTKKDNSATLTIPNSTITGYDTVTVSADRWSDTDLLLDYSMSYKGSESINFGTFFDSFHNFGPDAKTLSVQVEDDEVDESADYSLSYSESTFCATPGSEQADAAQSVWEALSDGSRIAVTTKSDDDSKIILPVGSAIYLKSTDSIDPEEDYYYESITVTNAKLTLDNFDDLDSMAEEIASHTTYSDENDTISPNSDAYKLILKAGTTIAVKTRVITILKDLTITLNGGDAFFAAIEEPLDTGLDGLYHSFVDADGKALSSVKGTSAAEAAARIVDAIFAGLKAGTEDNELIFKFDTPTTTSSDAIVSYSEGNVKPYTAANANSAVTSAGQGDVLVVNAPVSIGDTTPEATNQITVAADSVIKVESSAAAGTGAGTVSASEITYTPAGETGTKTAVVVNKGDNTVALDVETLFTKHDSVKQNAGEAEDDTSFSDFVQPAAVVANAVAKNSTIEVSEITEVELKLANKPQTSYSPVAVRNTVADDNTNPETPETVNSAAVVEVHPEVTIKSSSAGEVTYEVENGQLVDGATFLYTITGLNGGQYYNVYHVHGDNSVELVDEVKQADGSGDGNGWITVALDNFSYLVSVPTSGGAVSSTEEVKIGTLQGEFGTAYQMKISFRYLVDGVNYGAEIPEGYQLKVWLEDGNSDGSDRLLPLMTDSDYNSEMEWTCYKLSYEDDTNLGRIYTVTAKIFTKNLDKPISIELINNAAENVTVRGISLSGSEAVGTNVGYSILDYLTKLMEKDGISTAKYNAYQDLRTALNSACTTLRTAETHFKS